jgi:hypothetical protein
MKLETITTDIKKLEQALKIIEETENYLHFQKSLIMRDAQVKFLQSL